VVLREAEVAERQFSDWSMASNILTDGALGSIVDQVRGAIADCDVITTAYLLGFAEQKAAA
jgi:hypothetical protein